MKTNTKQTPSWSDTNWRAVASHMSKGFKDAVNLSSTVNFFVKSDKLQKLFVQCFLLNGAIFVGSVVILDYLAAPIFVSAFGGSTPSNETMLHDKTVNTLSRSFSLLKNDANVKFFWIYPLYTLSFLFNAIWYGEIAKISYELNEKRKAQIQRRAGGTPAPPAQQAPNLSFRKAIVDKITDQIYLNILLLFFVIQQSVASYIPFIGTFLEFLTFTWYSAFYSFQFLWSYHSEINLQKQLEYFERHWAYMLGFGAPPALASYFFPFFINAGIWAMLFPVFIVLAIRSSPPSIKGDMPPLHVFHYSKKVSNFIITCFKRTQQKRSRTLQQQQAAQEVQSVKFNLPKTE
ncbi:etoposide-induced protein [Acrasis kona]|uniref:Etoposide-induced protein n=1 Tax=Acrasis kona TaxID=1008807 RepID=A0AAW2ZA76_9EUKA